MATTDHGSPSPSWWSLPAKVIGLVVGLAALGTAVVEIAKWPSWLLVALVPVALVAVISLTPLPLWRKVGAIAIGLAAIGVSGIVYVAVGTVSHRPHSHFRAGKAAPKPKVPRRPSPFAVHVQAGVREVVTTREDLVAVTETSSISGLDGTSFNPMGPVLSTRAPVEHVLECADRLWTTFGEGMIATVNRDRMRLGPAVRYGDPMDAGPSGGMIACGDGDAAYVAMSREGKVVKVSADPLRTEKVIKNVGEEISDLTFTNHVLYALDEAQAAIVTIKDDVPSRWILTMLHPAQIVPLKNGSVLVTHEVSRCLGFATQGVHKEQGADWSLKGPVVFARVGKETGVVLDATGTAYRFDAGSGELLDEPLLVPTAKKMRTGTVLPSGHTILAGESDPRLIDIPPGAWRALRKDQRPAQGCLAAG